MCYVFVCVSFDKKNYENVSIKHYSRMCKLLNLNTMLTKCVRISNHCVTYRSDADQGGDPPGGGGARRPERFASNAVEGVGSAQRNTAGE